MTGKAESYLPFGSVCVILALLVGCGSVAEAEDDGAILSAADWVVIQVMGPLLPIHPAEAATNCILRAATADELRVLARDGGRQPGPTAKATIRAIVQRPQAQSCFSAVGVPLLVDDLM